MAIKVFWVGYDGGLYIDLAKNMFQEHDWYPVAWSATSNLRKQVMKSFPNIQFFDAINAAKGRYLLPNCQVTADGLFLEKHAREMLLTIEQMDRMDPMNAFSFQERWDHFRALVNFWQVKLKELSPDIVLFALPPHMIYDYVIFLLCEINAIHTLSWLHTSMPGRVLLMRNYKQGCPILRTTCQKKLDSLAGADPKLSPIAENYYQKLRGPYEQGIPGYITQLDKKLSHINSTKNIYDFIVNYVHPKSISNKIKSSIEGLTRPVPLNYIKQKNKSIQSSELNKKEFKSYKRRSNIDRLKLYKSYQELAEKPTPQEKYIFFALHYQPEMTTNPLGGVYTDQLMALEMLASNLPSGWKLYIKEAPLSFMPLYRLAYHRNLEYYKKIKEIPGTRLVTMESSSFELIDKCQATATITGTAGWESVVRGKPSIVFGYAWYRDCEGVHYINSNADLKNLIARLKDDNLPVDQRKVRTYIAALDESAVTGYVEMNKQANDQVSKEINIQNLSDALAAFYTP